MKKFLVMAAAMLAAAGAAADEAAIRRVVQEKLGEVRIVDIEPAPVRGLYEVRLQSPQGPQVIYTDEDGRHIFVGTLYDARRDRNLTEERLRKLSAIDFATLPLDLAVKVQRGNGRRVLAIFADPYCPACRQFEQALATVDDITVYYFMYPVIHPELVEHSRAVWCSPDRAKAWVALATKAKPEPPAAKGTCATPIERILRLGRSLGVNSTPTLFLATGERIRGGVRATDLVVLLDEAAGKARRK